MVFKSIRGVRRKMAKAAEAPVSGWSSPRTRRRRARMSSASSQAACGLEGDSFFITSKAANFGTLVPA